MKKAEVITNGNVNLQRIVTEGTQIQTQKPNSMFTLTNEACDLLFTQLPLEQKQLIASALLHVKKQDVSYKEIAKDDGFTSIVSARVAGTLCAGLRDIEPDVDINADAIQLLTFVLNYAIERTNK